MNIFSDRGLERVQLGPLWQEESEDWLRFYPEGLPREWRLNFVAHYWPTVLLPTSAWGSWAAPERDWSEAPEELRLFFRLPSDLGPDVVTSSCLVAKLGERLGGILLAEWVNAGVPVAWRDRIYAREASAPLTLPALSGAQLSIYGAATRRILVVSALPDLAPRATRMLLEALIRDYDDGREILILIEASPRQMEQITEIGRLLGLGTLKSRLSHAES
jgi:hypothetical protein